MPSLGRIHVENQRLLVTEYLEKVFAFRPLYAVSWPALFSFVPIFHENMAAIKGLCVVYLFDFILIFIGLRLLNSGTRKLFEAFSRNPSDFWIFAHIYTLRVQHLTKTQKGQKTTACPQIAVVIRGVSN